MTVCKLCGEKQRAKELCIRHYYQEFRQAKRKNKPFDVDDFWLFVKKEMKIDN